jgi:hypothetical protein
MCELLLLSALEYTGQGGQQAAAAYGVIGLRQYRLWIVKKYYSADQIKKCEMGWACGTCGGQERRIQGLGGET